jgi:hypothetical protein
MARLIRIGQLTHTTDDEQEHELVGWKYIEERNRAAQAHVKRSLCVAARSHTLL